jgi:hypothetical protein
MLDERQLRDAVRSVLDQPAPPSAANLDTVLRRGRRRAVMRRTGTFGGVAAAVLAIAIGATALPGLQGGGQTGPAIATTASPAVAGSASSPATTGAASPDWPPGWTPVSAAPQTKETASPGSGSPPRGSDDFDRSKWGCTSGVHRLPPPTTNIRPEHEVVPAFEAAVAKVAAPAQVRRVRQPVWYMRDPKNDEQLGHVAVDVTDAAGTGSVQLEVVRFGGTAEQNADANAYSYGNCARPVRKTLPDGTILQMYPVNDIDARQPTRPVRVFTPNGREYIATAASYGSSNLPPEGEGGLVNGGRGSVPLTAAQLAQLAEELAKLG